MKHVENVGFRLRHLFLIFYKNRTESRVLHSVWLSHVQGFQGWGVGKMIDGESGVDRYLTDENMIKHPRQPEKALLSAQETFFPP